MLTGKLLATACTLAAALQSFVAHGASHSSPGTAGWWQMRLGRLSCLAGTTPGALTKPQGIRLPFVRTGCTAGHPFSRLAAPFCTGSGSRVGQSPRGLQAHASAADTKALPAMGAAAPSAGDLDLMASRADFSWVDQLNKDPEADQNAPNRSRRQVKSGHYVPVKPVPLAAPKLVIHSPAMAADLGISEEEVQSERFTAFFSGDIDQVEGMKSWATPYALSIMGDRMNSNCPFGNGNGYGDGRAISVGEIVVDGKRWEMQLKGSGPTPFCRGGDGRAVLRSSIREFLASEAMHNLGVDTTRALSLIKSREDTIMRPWYSEITEDHPQLKKLPAEQRRAMLKQKRDPDMMIEEFCAITTRVAPSFLRVGHVDLFARRADASGATEAQKEELVKILDHALFREYPECGLEANASTEEKVNAVLEGFGDRLAAMIGGWLRVGFCQGNFNADNCLVGGRTMDYGPFGFMDEYDPMFAKWTGSGKHYSFMNQPGAALANFHTLALSLGSLLPDGDSKVQEAVQSVATKLQRAVDETWRMKLGFPATADGINEARSLFEELEPLMRSSKADFTVLFRQLAALVELAPDATDEALLAPLKDAFYAPQVPGTKGKWTAWIRKWKDALSSAHESVHMGEVAAQMRLVNPKYIPREWMLVKAYEAAKGGDESVVHELFNLFEKPYDEQPEMEAMYGGKAPDDALLTGGTAFMS